MCEYMELKTIFLLFQCGVEISSNSFLTLFLSKLLFTQHNLAINFLLFFKLEALFKYEHETSIKNVEFLILVP